MKAFIEQLQLKGFSHNSTLSDSFVKLLKTDPGSVVSLFSDNSRDFSRIAPLLTTVILLVCVIDTRGYTHIWKIFMSKNFSFFKSCLSKLMMVNDPVVVVVNFEIYFPKISINASYNHQFLLKIVLRRLF